MISFLFLSPQIEDGHHNVKRPPPPILIECAYQHKIQHGCHIG